MVVFRAADFVTKSVKYCGLCDSTGHYEINCAKKPVNAYSTTTDSQNTESNTILDSGCSTSLITDTNPIVLTNKTEARTQIKGISPDTLIASEHGYAGPVECVRVPALEVNLLSIGSLTKAKFAFNFQGDVCTIQTPGGKVLQIPRDTDNLYRLPNIEEITVDNAAVTDSENILKHIPIKL